MGRERGGTLDSIREKGYLGKVLLHELLIARRGVGQEGIELVLHTYARKMRRGEGKG